MAFEQMMAMAGSGEEARPVDGGKIPVGPKDGANVEKAMGMLQAMASQMNEVLQMLGPDTSQDIVFDKNNPAETMGDAKMSTQQKSMQRGSMIANLARLRK